MTTFNVSADELRQLSIDKPGTATDATVAAAKQKLLERAEADGLRIVDDFRVIEWFWTDENREMTRVDGLFCPVRYFALA